MHPEVLSRYEVLLYNQVAVQFGHQGPPWAGSDMLLHMPVLEHFASRCDSVLELGTRDGHSTLALLAGLSGRPWTRMTSLDIRPTPFVEWLAPLAPNWSFRAVDTADESVAADIEPADLVLIDTLHTDRHIRRELDLYGKKASRFIVFHDTDTCGELDRSGQNPNEKGISDAIRDFTRSGWRLEYETCRCNGLQVFSRKDF